MIIKTQTRNKNSYKKALMNQGTIMTLIIRKEKITNMLLLKMRGGQSSNIREHNYKN